MFDGIDLKAVTVAGALKASFIEALNIGVLRKLLGL